MNPDQGFVDLRLNRQEGQTDDGFWPSFTDIMTVVVMIFMLAMVVLLLRNMELVQQLRATMEAEREAAELARTTGEQKETLAGQLSTARREIDRLRERVRRMETLSEQQEAAIASQHHQIARLSDERERLQQQGTEQAARAAQLQSRLGSTQQNLQALRASHDQTLAEQARARSELERLQSDHQARGRTLDDLSREAARLKSELSALSGESAALRTKLAIQEQALTQALARLKEADLSLSDLREDYSSLKLKYDDLVKPARSAEGRYVAEVKVTKAADGGLSLRFRDSRDAEFRPVTRQELDSYLGRLKAQHHEGLYVRVIIPEDSGLGYNEAWSFTSDILSRYDYYYQGPPAEPDGAPDSRE
jgi:chromosome segregation ATPase